VPVACRTDRLNTTFPSRTQLTKTTRDFGPRKSAIRAHGTRSGCKPAWQFRRLVTAPARYQARCLTAVDGESVIHREARPKRGVATSRRFLIPFTDVTVGSAVGCTAGRRRFATINPAWEGSRASRDLTSSLKPESAKDLSQSDGCGAAWKCGMRLSATLECDYTG